MSRVRNEDRPAAQPPAYTRATMRDDFDPRDAPPPAASHNPVHDYVRPPAGLDVVAGVQGALALLLAIALWRTHDPAAGWIGTVAGWIVVVVFAASGVGLMRRRGWGWWTTCAVYYFLFFLTPVLLIRWTSGWDRYPAGAMLVNFVLAVGMLTYLNLPRVVRFFRFGPQGVATPRDRVTPLATGLALAAAYLVVSLIRRR